MPFGYVEYSYPYPQLFHKELLWVDKNCNCYFAFKLNDLDNWRYWAGNASHALATGSLLTDYGTSESAAQTNYLTTTRDSAGKIIAVLPANFQAKYARVYIQTGSNVALWEWHPSVFITANDIISGTLEITDMLSDRPVITVKKSGVERLRIGSLVGTTMGLQGRDSNGNLTFSLDTDSDDPFVIKYADQKTLELELMKVNFQSISWAQFAIFDALDDETKRASPDPSTNDARVFKSKLDNGGDATASKEFGFVSKTYPSITTVDTGSPSSTGSGFLEDDTKEWYTDECKNLVLVDTNGSQFNVISNTGIRLIVSGTPSSMGDYYLKTALPAYAIAFASFIDETEGAGYGYTKLEVSFDNGAHYQTFLDTDNGDNFLGGTVAIAYPGKDYIVKITLKNDGAGNGAILHKFLVCTDPSVWRY